MQSFKLFNDVLIPKWYCLRPWLRFPLTIEEEMKPKIWTDITKMLSSSGAIWELRSACWSLHTKVCHSLQAFDQYRLLHERCRNQREGPFHSSTETSTRPSSTVISLSICTRSSRESRSSCALLALEAATANVNIFKKARSLFDYIMRPFVDDCKYLVQLRVMLFNVSPIPQRTSKSTWAIP